MHWCYRIAVLILLLAPFYGCGKKGPLYLPEPTPARSFGPSA